MAKMFFKGSMACEDVKAWVGSARFYGSDDKAAKVDNGAFVVLGDLDGDAVYDANDISYNVYKAKAPALASDKVVVLDYAGINEANIQGNDYKYGIKLYDLEVPAGRVCRFRRLFLGDKFWLGEGNFESAIGTNKYAQLVANKVCLAPIASAPASGFCVKILSESEMTTGMIANGKKYLVEVVQL